MVVGAGWRKSTASVSEECVEVRKTEDSVLVRDSKNPDGANLEFTVGEWRAFLIGARRGEFDLPDEAR